MATQPTPGICSSSKRETIGHRQYDVRLSVPLDPSQSRGAPEYFEEEVDEPYYRPLLRAAFKGDWESATRFFEQDAASKMAKITTRSETLLHIAALSAHDQFLENLVGLLSPNPVALEMVDCDGRTALHNAVLCGRIRMVKALVRSNPKLTQLADKEGRVPLGISAQEASMRKEIVWFLATSTTDEGANQPFSSSSAIDTMIELTYASHHDITLYLAGRYPDLLTKKSTKYYDLSIVGALAVMKSDFPSGTRLSVLEALIYKCIPVNLSYKPTNKNSDPALRCPLRSLWNAVKSVVPIIKRVHEVKLRHMAAIELAKQVCMAISYMNITEIIEFFGMGDVQGLLYQATANGISEIVKLCIQFFPELIHFRPAGKSLPIVAVAFRRARTLGLFLKLSSTAESSLVLRPTLNDSMAMMHAVAVYSPRSDVVTKVAGAAFGMQRELQWYKIVESCLISHVTKLPWLKRHLEDIPITLWNAFVENHKELLENGEKWVKDTANSCMLVSTLIATILFAAAFTVPGGNDDNTGVPLLLGQDSLLVFAISDALGLLSSVTAILLFLAILTSRYEAQDFLYSLPKKILMGLCFLFLSLAFMLVAFAATLTMVLEKRLEWILIPIILLSSIPVALFAILQLPLLFQMVQSTYGSSIFRPEDIWDGVN
ncbi:hypothetical protein ACJRO7_015972 [Eucalyptus globulus]|uniref:PGG domain-containing protein n=1 Tax=Eucalyptus globulus TaxID=34317 RepID=A0ABD3L949_EUCGL